MLDLIGNKQFENTDCQRNLKEPEKVRNVKILEDLRSSWGICFYPHMDSNLLFEEVLIIDPRSCVIFSKP